MVILGLWVCDGGERERERERESNVGLLPMKASILEREMKTVVVRPANN
jgi:hypothetical protein